LDVRSMVLSNTILCPKSTVTTTRAEGDVSDDGGLVLPAMVSEFAVGCGVTLETAPGWLFD